MTRPDNGTATSTGMLRSRHSLEYLRANWLVCILMLTAMVLAVVDPKAPSTMLRLVDWRTIGALTGLLVITKAIELSGVLQHVAMHVTRHVVSQRHLALVLIALSGGLAAFLTNDVSLFLIVPLTRSLSNRAQLPVSRLVVCEALAVNTGSALTPIGNPQNLFLWQSSGMAFTKFVCMMSPMVMAECILLLIAVWFLFEPVPLKLHPDHLETADDWRLLALSVLLFAAFVAMLDMQIVAPSVALVISAYALSWRRVLWHVDWMLLAIIGLMFLDLSQIAMLPVVADVARRLPIGNAPYAYFAAIVLSQLISNVPATIFLKHYVHDLPALAYGVNVGGYGLAIGSLANLIALRLLAERGTVRQFHLISTIFLAVSTLAALMTLYLRT